MKQLEQTFWFLFNHSINRNETNANLIITPMLMFTKSGFDW